MENKFIDSRRIILKVVVFLCLLFIFFNWDTIEKFLATIFK